LLGFVNEQLSVGERVYLQNTPITELSDKSTINDNIYLIDAKNTDNLKVYGRVDIGEKI
jgi:hypothetical protein